jgi:hypothetical protein
MRLSQKKLGWRALRPLKYLIAPFEGAALLRKARSLTQIAHVKDTYFHYSFKPSSIADESYKRMAKAHPLLTFLPASPVKNFQMLALNHSPDDNAVIKDSVFVKRLVRFFTQRVF